MLDLSDVARDTLWDDGKRGLHRFSWEISFLDGPGNRVALQHVVGNGGESVFKRLESRTEKRCDSSGCHVLFNDRYIPPPYPNQGRSRGQGRGVWNVEVVKTWWLVDSTSANIVAPFRRYVKGIVEIQY